MTENIETSFSELDNTDQNDCKIVLEVLDRIGDKWTIMVVGALTSGCVRFNALQRSIPGISHRMLTLTLRGLQRDGLVKRVAELAADGVEASAFPADLSNPDNIPGLIQSIEERFGAIDVAVYAPVPSDVAFVSAVELDAAKAQSFANIFLISPIEVFHSILPGMLARGDGAVIIVSGLSAVMAMPGMSGPGPLMAGARNYVLGLNAELAPNGVYAGTVSIGGAIDRSESFRAIIASGVSIEDMGYPVIDPDDISQEIWELITKRDKAEAIIPQMPTV